MWKESDGTAISPNLFIRETAGGRMLTEGFGCDSPWELQEDGVSS
jgi:hypothetical protein